MLNEEHTITLVNRADVPRITAFIRAMNKGVFRPQGPGVSGIIGGVLHRKKK